MHYLPQSQYTLEEIIEQCRSAINRIPTVSTPYDDSFYDELLEFEEYLKLIGLK